MEALDRLSTAPLQHSLPLRPPDPLPSPLGILGRTFETEERVQSAFVVLAPPPAESPGRSEPDPLLQQEFSWLSSTTSSPLEMLTTRFIVVPPTSSPLLSDPTSDPVDANPTPSTPSTPSTEGRPSTNSAAELADPLPSDSVPSTVAGNSTETDRSLFRVPSDVFASHHSSPGSRSPRSSSACARKVSWGDDEGSKLARHLLFRKNDETWRCSPTSMGPLLQAPGSRSVHTELCSELPKSDEQMTAALCRKAVQLESILVTVPMIMLTVRCLNIAFHKRLAVHYTFDSWVNTQLAEGAFLASVDSLSDRFTVSVCFPADSKCSMEFAIEYQVEEMHHWDNNEGQNYRLTLQPRGTELPLACFKRPSKSALRSDSSRSGSGSTELDPTHLAALLAKLEHHSLDTASPTLPSSPSSTQATGTTTTRDELNVDEEEEDGEEDAADGAEV
eukprot:m.697786 g.697786  ORF g.697786 m.697786 type:complete len:446 (-) comp58682_c0_seq18:1854-3191(-)